MPPEPAAALSVPATPTFPRTRDRLRIADVAVFYGERGGGIRTYLEAKAEFASRTGAFEHHLVVPGRRAAETAANRHEQPSLQLAASNGYRIPLGSAGLHSTVRALKPDVVLLHDPFWTPRPTSRAAHEIGAAVIAVHHSSAALHAAGLPGPALRLARLRARLGRRRAADDHLDESGLDDSPKYDGVFGWMRHDRAGIFWLIERCRRLGYDARRIVERYEEHVEDVLVNVFYALGLRALARLDAEHGALYAARADRTESALLARCYDERTGLFFDLAGAGDRQVAVSTWSSLAPLALRSLPDDLRRRLVEEHLLDRRRYHAPCGILSVAIEEPSFKPGFALWRCWRGPSWMNTAWLLVPAMWELGYRREAARVVPSLELSVDRYGFREYYNPLTGRGLAARGFGFSTLLVDLLARSGIDPREPSAGGRMMAR